MPAPGGPRVRSAVTGARDATRAVRQRVFASPRVRACSRVRMFVCPRVRPAITPAPACSPLLPARSCACAPVCLAVRWACPPSGPPNRLPFLSASPCTDRLPVRLTGRATALSVRFSLHRPFTCQHIFLFWGVSFLEGASLLCGCGRVCVSGSGRTEDATQRAFTCETFVRVPGKTPLAEPLWTMPAIDMAATVPLRGHCRVLCALHARPCLKTPR